MRQQGWFGDAAIDFVWTIWRERRQKGQHRDREQRHEADEREMVPTKAAPDDGDL